MFQNTSQALTLAVEHTLPPGIKQTLRNIAAAAFRRWHPQRLTQPASSRRAFLIEDARGHQDQSPGGGSIPRALSILSEANEAVADHQGTRRHVVTSGIDSSENGHFNDPRGCFPTTTFELRHWTGRGNRFGPHHSEHPNALPKS
jgi:hypothetical protein